MSLFVRKKRPPSPKEEILLLRSSNRAAWLASMAAGVSLVVSVGAAYYTYQADRQSKEEEVVIQASRETLDYPTTLRGYVGGRTYPRGILGALFSVIVVNRSAVAVSLTKYSVEDKQFGYEGVDQGLLATDLSRMALPVSIEPGHATRLLLRIGLMMDRESYEIARQAVASRASGVPSMRALLAVLYTQGTDHYGNRVGTMWGKHRLGVGAIHDQQFTIAFTTGRGRELSCVTSWYGTHEVALPALWQ